MSRSKTSVLWLLAAIIALVAVPAGASAKPTITLSGSTSVAPLATLLAQKYVKSCKGCVKFKLLQGGSDVGIADVSRGRVTIGMSSRDPKPSDPGGITFNRIAKDAICLVTNKANGVAGLDQNAVQSIFSGSVRSWSQVPGAKQQGTIDLFVRTPASGTQDAFQKIFMGDSKVFSGASQKASNGLVQQSVQRDKAGIGYVSLAFTKGLTTASYKGVPCNLRNAKSGQYGGVRSFYFVTRGAAKGPVKKWIKWVRNNPAALRIAAKEWVPFK
ncbi:MAG: substrate-binding domain-containing protein [Solirubrobacterales bacterium]|nr:substrate-binding domain-containing protein [Solirubrobacterales bacterium]